MAKTDFTRVEGALEEGLQRMTRSRLLAYSDTASKVGEGTEGMRRRRKKAAEISLQRQEERRLLAAAMQFDINQLFKKDYHLYTKLGTHHEEIMDLLKRAATLNESEWQRLEIIKHALDSYKQDLRQKQPIIADDDLIAQERLRHINKRFNTNERWLPLH